MLLFSSPFSGDPTDALPQLQLQLIEPQRDNEWSGRHQQLDEGRFPGNANICKGNVEAILISTYLRERIFEQELLNFKSTWLPPTWHFTYLYHFPQTRTALPKEIHISASALSLAVVSYMFLCRSELGLPWMVTSVTCNGEKPHAQWERCRGKLKDEHGLEASFYSIQLVLC